MILSTAFELSGLLSSIFFLTSLLFDRVTFLECIFLAIPLHMVCVTWLGIAVSFVLGTLNPLALVVSTIVTTIPLPFLYARAQARVRKGMLTTFLEECKQFMPFTIYILTSTYILYRYFVSTHFLYEKPHGGWYSSGSTWGDLPFHLNLISSYGVGRNSKIRFGFHDSPIFTGSKLIYPILPDYHSALLVAGGWSLRQSFTFPAIGLLVSYVALMFFFTWRFTGSKLGGMIAPILSLASGGNAWYHDNWWKEWRSSKRPLGDFLQGKGDNYVHYQKSGEALWFQTLTDMLLPQRSALLAYPMCLSALTLIWIGLHSSGDLPAVVQRGDGSDKTNKPSRVKALGPWVLFLVAGLLVGVLPYAQGHAYIAMAVCTASLAALHLPLKPSALIPYIRQWLFFIVPSVGLGLPQLYMLSGQAEKWGFVRFNPMWVEPSLGENIFHAWYRSLGFLVPVCILGALFLLSWRQWRYWVALWVVFAVGNYVQFQPWKLDNCKILQVWHWTVCAIVGASIAYLWTGRRPVPQVFASSTPPAAAAVQPPPSKKTRRQQSAFEELVDGLMLRQITVIVVFIPLIMSGGLCLVKEVALDWELFNKSDREVADFVQEKTPIDSVWLSSDQHNSPVSCLAGRHLLVGYKGWLDSHGYDWPGRSNDVNLMYSGDPRALDLLARYKVNYVIIGSQERRENKANERFFQDKKEKFERVFRNQAYTVYKVK
mmetsp:Transcript_40910/g.66347  ORF Transcript_40910/g.66347 Transcript_40910/m.66347 type:complete len:712 (-) Transcript_40910:130-2265(-)|eukprot:CAMPEP_0184658950 /NCGR_PEP_ID=MMETSP0308-20130426/27474_1 /TAXON_ID=38269 /ORGANISM="Gloeochaete witrockiana, Strain SAG 46.84" /LENGTH=711 /DNA_ID=CAMNT_0027098325 /DNA_START=22 /DNA_END=2157 /DNA_ORIENTATION=-